MAFCKKNDVILFNLIKNNSFCAKKGGSKNKISKQLKVLSIATLLSFYCPTAVNAVGISENPEDLTKTTLDELHNNGTKMPNGEVYPKSSYILKEVSEPEIPMPNIITKYILDPVTKKIAPHYFEVILKEPSVSYTNTITTHTENTATTNYNSTEFKNISVEKTEKSFTQDELDNFDTISKGGALNNTGIITSINNSNFKNNKNTITIEDPASASGFNSVGGAIYNEGEIGSIDATNFTNNSVIVNRDISDRTDYVLGGAIYNSGEIGTIVGDFINNSAIGQSAYVQGGAIFNDGELDTIVGDFNSNYASSKESASGGAIYNSGQINKITGKFNNNYAEAKGDYSSSTGGAIFNEGTITEIEADFTGNYTKSTARSNNYDSSSEGGAIYNKDYQNIGSIKGNFIKNSSNANYEDHKANVSGGAIRNYGEINKLHSDFRENSANSISANNSAYSAGGAIYGSYLSILADVVGNFNNNSSNATSNSGTMHTETAAYGGAIANIAGEIRSLSGNFDSNSAVANTLANNSSAKGGAIYYELSGNNYSSLNSKINNSEFTNNKAVANSVDGVSNAEGGAIYNADHSNYSYVNGLVGIASIKGNFAKNSANAVSTNGNATASGGALYSEGIYGSYYNSVADIISNFTDNIANAVSGTKSALARGGALINLNKIGNIVGNFEGNKASASSNTGQAIAQGGALYSNYANDSYSGPKGIKSIKGDFIKNSATAISADSTSIATGGAIYGSYDGTITDVTSNFVENIVAATSKSAKANTSAYAYGGAVSTMVDKSNYGYSYSGKISNITGDFTGNSAIAKSNAGTAEAKGGAVYHKRAENNDYYKPMSLIDTNFINNKAEATSETGNAIAQGGAIYTEGEVVNLIAKNNNIIFLGNTANGNSNAIHMGAMERYYVGSGLYHITKLNLNTNDGKSITFNDSITSSNKGGIDTKEININSDISGESSLGHNEATEGAVILNADMSGYTGKVNLHNGTLKVGENGTFFGNGTNLVDFNFTKGNLDLGNGKIDKIILNNYASTDDSKIIADANLDTGEIDNFTANSVNAGSKLKFTSINVLKNGIKDVLTLFNGASPVLSGEATTFTKNAKYIFTPGAASGTIQVNKTEGGYNLYDAVKDGSKNRTYSMGEAEVVDKDLTDMFGGNDAELTIAGNGNSIEGENHQGIVVHSAQTLNVYEVGSVDDTGAAANSWKNHNSDNGGAIENSGNLKITSVIFDKNKANETGGAIKNNGEATINNAAFIKNSSKNSGGAIYNEGKLDLSDTSFVENSVDGETRAMKTGGAIQNVGGNITLSALNSDINFIGNTADGAGNDIHTENVLNPDGTVDKLGAITFTGTKNTNITGGISGDGNVVKTGTGSLNLGGNNGNFAGEFALKEGSINLVKDSTYFNAKNTNIYNNTTFNMANNQKNSVNFGNLYLEGKTNIGLDVDLANSNADYISANSIDPNSEGILNIKNIFLMSDTTKREIFIDVIDTSNGLSQLGELDSSATSALGPIYKYGISYDKNTGQLFFNSAGGGGNNGYSGYNPAIMTGPVAQQAAYLGMVENYINAFANMDMVMLMPKKDRDALLYKNRYAAADGSLTFTPSMMPEEDKGLWFRPYSTFEKVNLNNGPDVSNIMYGSLFGGDSPLQQTKWGFSRVFSAYAGYTGSHQTFDGQGIYQNGGLLGATTVFYKGNFFSGLTANVGAIQAQASTNFGQDNFTMLTAGVASKSGYNFGFLDEKLILQPSFMMSYSFVNTFDYTTSSNVSISQEPLNAIQIVPGIKLIGNLKNSWQPYLAVSMVWNIIDKTRFRANDVSLPDLSVNPYVLYGIGVQKHWGERFTGFAQSMFRGGGRNGVGLQVGFRWSI